MSQRGISKGLLVCHSVRLAKVWVDQIEISIPLGVEPEPKQIEGISDLIDSLHSYDCSVCSVVAHKLDDAMCRWCELLLDA
ncbi:hypothetical protein PM2_06 [Pseudoalteromonas phage PM2]|uniref:Uncharacterized protein Gp-e n=1 Tax=Pseudoalteromonas phage PM2 TaxID=2905728 RepID=GPE_BPPM2|nr:hypothetical protein PM2_06 [Pseudoalteromonas phage PM2]Q9XJS4.1 RecName: Full=Uncharacterized protein Gp-e [Pseudoalteromonas phage PM2]AAD43542.1 gp e [Pseudoalteromonas phage PM2]